VRFFAVFIIAIVAVRTFYASSTESTERTSMKGKVCQDLHLMELNELACNLIRNNCQLVAAFAKTNFNPLLLDDVVVVGK